MYVHSQKFGYFGHWLSDVNRLEMKNFDTHLVFIAILSITNQKFQRNPKVLNFDFSGLQIYLRACKVPFATVQKNTFGPLNE